MVYTHRQRVRYCDVDKMNIVYHSRYLDYWEWARTELFRKLGHPYSKIEAAGYLLPSKSIEINYHNPAHYDDEILVHCKLISFSQIRVEFEYKTEIPNGVMVASGKSLHIFTNHEFKVTRLNKSLYLLLKKDTHENHPSI